MTKLELEAWLASVDMCTNMDALTDLYLRFSRTKGSHKWVSTFSAHYNPKWLELMSAARKPLYELDKRCR